MFQVNHIRMGLLNGPVGYLLVAVAAFGYYLYSLRLPIEFKDLNSLSYVTNSCKVLPGVGATEDVVVDPSTGHVYIAHAPAQDRRGKFFPGLNRWGKDYEESAYLHSISIMDPETQKITALEFEGFEGHDYVAHGINVVPSNDPAQKSSHVFVVNHKRSGSVVSVFKHEHGSKTLQYQHDFKSPKIYTPNSVAPIGPNEIYVTNDHFFPQGLLRVAEFMLMPIGSTNVMHCTYNPQSGATSCNKATDKLGMANGIEYIPARDEIVVAESTTGRVTFFPRLKGPKDNGRLDAVHKRATNIGAGVDNVRIIPGTNDVIVTAFPDMHKLVDQMGHTTDTSISVPAMAVVLKESESYTKSKVVYHSNGEGSDALSFMTGFAVLPQQNLVVGGSVVNEGLLVCDLPKNF